MSAAEWDGWDVALPATVAERDEAAHEVLAVGRRRALALIVDGKRGQALYQLTRALLEAAEVLELPVVEVRYRAQIGTDAGAIDQSGLTRPLTFAIVKEA